MMHKNYIFFFLFFLSLNSFAQVDKMVWSERMKLKGILTTVGEIDGNLYFTRQTQYKVYLEKFQLDNMTPLGSTKLDLSGPEPGTGKLELEERLIINGKMVLFGSGYNSVQKRSKLYGMTINARGELETGWKELASMEVNNRINTGVFEVCLSSDTGKILIAIKAPEREIQRFKERFYFVVLDKDLNELWSKGFELPFSDKQTDILKFLVDKQGIAHVYANVSPASRKEKREANREKEDAHTKYILSFNPETEEVKEYEVSLDKKSIEQTAFNLDVNDNIILAGFYFDNINGRPGMSGFFHVRIPKNANEKEQVKITRFKDTISTRNKIRHLIPRKDGSMVLLSQYEYVSKTCYTDSRKNEVCNYVYFFNEILAMGISAEGDIVWKKDIVKSGNSHSPDYLSYGIFTTDTNIHIIFNDLQINYDTDGNRIDNKNLVVLKKSVLVGVTITDPGKISTRILIDDNKKNGAYVMPSSFRTLNSRTLFMLASIGQRGIKFGSFHFE